MKFMSTWALLPGSVKTAAEQFLAGGGLEGEGVTLLGRWHKADCTGGFTLYESNSAAAFIWGQRSGPICFQSQSRQCLRMGRLGLIWWLSLRSNSVPTYPSCHGLLGELFKPVARAVGKRHGPANAKVRRGPSLLSRTRLLRCVTREDMITRSHRVAGSASFQ